MSSDKSVREIGHEVVEIEASKIDGQIPKIVKFSSLARCGDEVWIENEGQVYRLRRTKLGKLILTK